MAGRSRLMIDEAERRFPVRIRVALPIGGLGERLNEIHHWLDQNGGADGWSITPSGTRGIPNDAMAIFFADATIASAFVARWCAGHRATPLNGLFQIREEEPKKRVPLKDHKTP